jgi:ABC-type lipoprotein release transport system permease subunit
MTVKSKEREIGILKTIGANNPQACNDLFLSRING